MTTSKILRTILLIGLLFGMYLICCDGCIGLFGTNRAVQYTFNLFFLLAYLPLCAYALVRSIYEKTEE